MTRRLVAAAAVAALWASVGFALSYDLEITDVSCPAVVTAGQTILVNNTVTEMNGLDATTDFTVGIYLSTNQAIDPAADTWLGERLVSGGLIAYESSSAATSVTLPAVLTPGSYYIGAYADINNTLPAEQQENDNDASFQVAVLGAGGWAGYWAIVDPEAASPLGAGCSPGGGGGPGPVAWFLPLLVLAGALIATRRATSGRDGSKARPAAAGLLALLALVAVAVAGCGGILLGDDGAEPIAPRSMADGSPDVTRLGSRLPAAMPDEVRQAPVAVRLGWLITAGEETAEYDSSLTFGAFYPGRLPWGSNGIPFEAGIDLAFWVDAEDIDAEATLVLWRFDCLFSRWSAGQSDADFYLLGGYTLVRSHWDVAGVEDENSASGLDVGAGLTWADIGLDVRLTWTLLLGVDKEDENIGSLFLFSAGYRF